MDDRTTPIVGSTVTGTWFGTVRTLVQFAPPTTTVSAATPSSSESDSSKDKGLYATAEKPFFSLVTAEVGVSMRAAPHSSKAVQFQPTRFAFED